MDLGTILSGPIGAIFGAVGAIGGKIVDYKMKQLDNEFQLQMRDKDMAQARAEAEAKYAITRLEGDTQLAIRDLDNLQTSAANDKATYGDNTLGRIVDFLRGITRPIITYAAMVLVFHVSWVSLRTGGLNGEQVERMLNEVLFMSGVAITWWFGTRPSTRNGRK